MNRSKDYVEPEIVEVQLNTELMLCISDIDDGMIEDIDYVTW